MLSLSDHFVKALVAQPETGMGFQTGNVYLKNGQVFNRATIVNSDTIVSIYGRNDIPFTEPEIDKIVVTHEKWVP